MSKLVLIAVLLLMPDALLAQSPSYPSRPVRLVIPAAPGGNPDVLARLLAPRLQASLGQPMVIDNQPGAAGVPAAIAITKLPPDGHVLFLGDSGAMAIAVAINPGLPYQPLRDFTLITALASLPTILVAHPAVPAASMQEFIALAKSRPGQLNYGSAGVGSIHQLTMAVFQMETGTSMVHVPYKGGSPMVAAIMAGEVQAGFSGIPNVMQAIRGGKLKAYGISALRRSRSMPDVPTFDEQGLKGFDVVTMLGLQGPAGMPREIVSRLQAAFARGLREPEVSERMVSLGIDLGENGTEHYAQYVKDEVQRYAAAVKAAGIKPE
jgi:tripartite-type tricarboxylate transporter receptor subunit TctC